MTQGKLKKSQLDKLYKQPQEKDLQLSDGGNLYLIVTKIGSCIFKYRVIINTSKAWYTLGYYPTLSLPEAREKAMAVKKQILNGINPITAQQETKNKLITLKDFADLYIKNRLPINRKAGRSSNTFINNMNRYIISEIGKYHISDITEVHIKKIIEAKVSQGKHSTALNIVSILRLLFEYAIEQKLITNTPIANTKYYNINSNRHRDRFLSLEEIQQCLQLLYKTPNIWLPFKIATHLLLILLLRKTELIHATWKQVNFEEQKFTLSTSKTGTALVIGLPTQAMELFKILKNIALDSDYIFPSFNNPQKPIHENSLNNHIQNINLMMFKDNNSQYFTVHDLRRTGATHLGEMEYPSDYIEMALNHTKAGIKKVYQRSQYLTQRKEMLQHWANVIDGLIGEELLPYGKKFLI